MNARSSLVRLRHHGLELGNRPRRADARHHVFALRVHEELAEELLRAGRRVAREAHTGRRPVAHVAEHHQLNVDGRADVVGDLVDAAVGDRALVVPGTEHGVAGPLELRQRILRERLAGLGLHQGLVSGHGLPQAVLAQVGVDLRAVRVS